MISSRAASLRQRQVNSDVTAGTWTGNFYLGLQQRIPFAYLRTISTYIDPVYRIHKPVLYS